MKQKNMFKNQDINEELWDIENNKESAKLIKILVRSSLKSQEMFILK